MPSMVVEKCDRTGTQVLVKCEGRANQFYLQRCQMYHNENPEIWFVEIDEWAPRIIQIRPFHSYIKHSTIGRNSWLVGEDLIFTKATVGLFPLTNWSFIVWPLLPGLVLLLSYWTNYSQQPYDIESIQRRTSRRKCRRFADLRMAFQDSLVTVKRSALRPDEMLRRLKHVWCSFFY